MTDYFDASAVAAILFKETTRARVDAIVSEGGDDILVSDFVVTEVSSAVSRLVRMDLRSPEMGRELIENLDDWVEAACDPIPLEAEDIRDATELVRNFTLKLRAPDALHLAICRRIDARLVTLDINLANAARVVGVDCVNPAAPAA